MKHEQIFLGGCSLLFIIILTSFSIPTKKLTIYLIGDSTMSVKEPKNYPETGWGMPFAVFFDSTVTVDNRAKNGRSTRTFIEEKRWEQVMDVLQEGDYVFIEFGHNDEVSTKKSYTTPNDFKANLVKFITETKSKKAIPILLTSVARRKFDSTGIIEDTHLSYSLITKKVAEETHTFFIDMNTMSMALFQKYGSENSKLFFNHLDKGEHPNYPNGIQDDTHFNELGARKIAELVLGSVKNIDNRLPQRIIVSNRK